MSCANVGRELAGGKLFCAGPVCPVGGAAANTNAIEFGAAAPLSQCISVLLFDDAAGDAISGIAGGIRHEIVGFRMDDQRRAAVVEQGICIVTERDALGNECGSAVAIGCDGEVG